jgi:PAS domain S-box-containing protein
MDAETVLARLWVAWQPIVDLDHGDIIGHEALIRGPHGTPWAEPRGLFPWAAQQGVDRDLEGRCRRLALDFARTHLPQGTLLFLNIDGRWPSLPDSPDLTVPCDVPLALEISESHPILDNPPLLEALAVWRRVGHRIVLDDYGTGYAAAATVLAVQPDVIKLDRRLIADLDQDFHKQSLVRALRAWTRDLGIVLVAEGVETHDEWQVLRDLGCDYGQGFLFGRPAPRPVTEGLGGQVPPVLKHPVPQSSGSDVLAFYADAVRGAEVASYVVDRGRRLVAWNGAAEALLGFKEEDLVGTPCFHNPLDHRDRNGQRLCAGACPLVWSMARQRAHSAVVTARARDGNRLIVKVWAVPLWDASARRVVGALEQFQLVASWPEASAGLSETDGDPASDHPLVG